MWDKKRPQYLRWKYIFSSLLLVSLFIEMNNIENYFTSSIDYLSTPAGCILEAVSVLSKKIKSLYIFRFSHLV